MRRPLALVPLAAGLLQAPSLAQSGCLAWSDGFDLPGIVGTVTAVTRFDDGSGPALYVSGGITRVEGLPVRGIARWDGASWSVPGEGQYDFASFQDLAVFDDGGGPALYGAGFFDNGPGAGHNVARWDGSSWAVVGTALSGGSSSFAASDLEVFDDGGGPALYAATIAPGNVWRFDGADWVAVAGAGADSGVEALAVFDDGSGPALYAAGVFSSIAGVAAPRIARWDGATWSAVGGGIGPSGFSEVHVLASHDDGGGTALYAAGIFADAGGLPVANVARWDGIAWSALAGGLDGHVYALASADVGEGPSLYAGGAFQSSAGAPLARVARWDGSAWWRLDGGASATVTSFGVFDGGEGAALWAGGQFSNAGEIASPRLAGWNAGGWHGYPTSLDGTNAPVRVLATLDAGDGPALYAGGDFVTAGSAAALHVARFDGAAWSPLGLGTDGPVEALAAFDDGSGGALYAGGTFLAAGGAPAARIARFDGTSWSPLGAGIDDGGVLALAAFDDGSGPALYAGGFFLGAAGLAANRIARWDGVAWSTVGGGANDDVSALVVFDDGSGPALYAGGRFSSAGGVAAPRVARWDGSAWSAVGALPGWVFALEVFDDGTGPALYAAGNTAPASPVQRWDGSAWVPVGALDGGMVFDLRAFDDGTGPALHAAQLGRVSRWDGIAWSSSSVTSSNGVTKVEALAAFDDGTSGGPDLYAGGSFGAVAGVFSANLARFEGCSAGLPYCAGDGSAAPCPCGNSGASGAGCDNSGSTGGARLASSGATNPDTLVLSASGELASALSIFLQGDASVGPVAFGDGLRCVGGALVRLYAGNASGGAIARPGPGDPTVSARSAALGDPLAPGDVRHYQVYYRDPSLAFCAGGGAFNVGNALRVTW